MAGACGIREFVDERGTTARGVGGEVADDEATIAEGLGIEESAGGRFAGPRERETVGTDTPEERIVSGSTDEDDVTERLGLGSSS